MTQIVDFASTVTPDQVKAAGYAGAQRYIPKDAASSVYVLSAGEVQQYRDLGLALAVNFESTSASWMAGGYNRGVSAANHVKTQLQNIGLTDIPRVYASADFHPADSTQLQAVVDCQRGFRDTLGDQGSAIYGFVEVLDAVRNAGVADHFWLCGSNKGLSGRSWINLWQHNNDQGTINGKTVDINDVLIAEFGQIGPGGTASTPTTSPSGTAGGPGKTSPNTNWQPSQMPTLVEGTTSDLVWRLQIWFNQNYQAYSNIDAGPQPPSRVGPQTMAVATEFQRRCNITPVNPFSWGPQSWTAAKREGFPG